MPVRGVLVDWEKVDEEGPGVSRLDLGQDTFANKLFADCSKSGTMPSGHYFIAWTFLTSVRDVQQIYMLGITP